MSGSTSYTGTTTITTPGLQAASLAGVLGAQIQLTSFEIGSDVITPSSAMTGVTSGGVMGTPVYTGTLSQVTYQVQNDSTLIYKITLDPTIGPFTIGNIGLFISNGQAGSGSTLFSITALPSATQKYINNFPTVGNDRVFYIIIQLSGIATITNLTILNTDESALPVLANKTFLPNPSSAPYPVYMLAADSDYGGVPALALRGDSSWYYIPTDFGWSSATTSGNVINLNANLFGSGVTVGQTVYFDTSAHQFLPGDVTIAARVPLGIRGANNSLIMSGGVYTATSNVFSAGILYYADGNPNFGALTTTVNSYPFGYSLSSQAFLITIGGTGGGGGSGVENEAIINPFFYN